MPERPTVLLVDELGRALGPSDKLEAHEAPGRLHLAFSVFLFRDRQLLLQQRATSKYHFPGIWANACCSHPAPGDAIVDSAERRVREELGLDADLDDVGTFIYRAVDPGSGLVEHELDHVLVGTLAVDAEPNPDPGEVAAVMWVPVRELSAGSAAELPDAMAPWFAEALEIALQTRAEAAIGGC